MYFDIIFLFFVQFILIQWSNNIIRYLKMAKMQELQELFAKHDDDQDGEINQSQIVSLLEDLAITDIYQGSINKIIRKMNHTRPDKNTLNFQQLQEYHDSLQTQAKHEIFKMKYSLLSYTSEVKSALDKSDESGTAAAPSAAPGQPYQHENPAKGNISVLVGAKKANYKSFVELQFEKNSSGAKSKPFVKVSVTSKSNEKAKELETVFRQIYENLMGLLSQEAPQWQGEISKVHLSSFVKDSTTTFIVTSTNQEIVDYLEMIPIAFSDIFDFKLEAQGKMKFAFDYDFNDFISKSESSFYDIFTKDNHFTMSLNMIGCMKAIRKLTSLAFKEHVSLSTHDPEEFFPVISLVHLERVEGQFEFQNSQLEGYELESKQELKQLLGELGGYLDELKGQKIDVRRLLELLEGLLEVEVNNGELKFKAGLSLMNINRVFLETEKSNYGVGDEEQQDVQQIFTM